MENDGRENQADIAACLSPGYGKSFVAQVVKRPFLGIKSASGAINTGVISSLIHSKCSAANRLAKVRILKDCEASSIKYFTNALGQQVFKSEPKPAQYLPDQSELGTGFIAWLKTNFGWLYAQAQTDASVGF